MKSEMRSIVVVSRLVSVMRNQVEQLKQLKFPTAAIGLGEEFEEDEKAARERKCELVFCPRTFLKSIHRARELRNKLDQIAARNVRVFLEKCIPFSR